jgi:hypothetical protein
MVLGFAGSGGYPEIHSNFGQHSSPRYREGLEYGLKMHALPGIKMVIEYKMCPCHRSEPSSPSLAASTSHLISTRNTCTLTDISQKP